MKIKHKQTKKTPVRALRKTNKRPSRASSKTEVRYEMHAVVPFRGLTRPRVSQIFRAAAQVVDIPADFTFSIAIVSNDMMHQLNRLYRGKDKPTDVLAFRYDDTSGEIVLGAQKLREQAQLYGHSVTVEAAYMLVHGILHILGWDHERSPKEEEEMKTLEYAILELCGLAFAR